MRSVLCGGHQDVIVVHNLLRWDATLANYWVVRAIVEQGGNCYVLEKSAGRNILLIRLEVFRPVNFPVELFLELMDSSDVLDEPLQVYLVLLSVNRIQVFEVCLEELLVPLAEAPVDQAPPSVLEVLVRLRDDQRRLNTRGSFEDATQVLAPS